MLFYSNPVVYNDKIFVLGKWAINVVYFNKDNDNYTHSDYGI